MYQFNNEQRRCFGLDQVEPHWKFIQLKTSHYDHHDAYAYVDGCVIKKCIFVSESQYYEYDYDDLLSDDLVYLLPKTNRGKPVKLSSATMMKRSNRGMAFAYYNHNCDAYIDIYCADNRLGYYNSKFERLRFETFDEFVAWVEQWCAETTEEDIVEIEEIKNRPRVHIKFREGDVFRFRLTRRLYGYGRIIRDYQRLEKEKIPYYRDFLGTAVLCSVFLVATEDRCVSVDQLKGLKSLPSMRLNESLIYYGEYEIIGNIPITDHEDYPYAYSRSLSFPDCHLKKILFQNGKDLLTIEGAELLPLSKDMFLYHGSGEVFKWLKLEVLLECIEKDSVVPYWDTPSVSVQEDLRNPKNADKLKAIREQFGLE